MDPSTCVLLQYNAKTWGAFPSLHKIESETAEQCHATELAVGQVFMFELCQVADATLGPWKQSFSWSTCALA